MKIYLKLKPHFTIVVLMLLMSSCAKIESSIASGMFMNNSQHSGFSNSKSVASAPKELWKVKTEGQVISSPVVVNGVLYIGSEDHKLYAIDATSGDIKWTYKTNGAINSTPAIHEDKVLFLSYDGFFYALNKDNGKLVWKFKTEGEHKFEVKDYYNGSFKPDYWDFYLSSAVVENNIVYFGSSDAHVYALDVATGEKVWQYKTEAGIHSSPAIFENALVIGSWDSNVYCLNATTGEENWKYQTGKDVDQYIWIGVQASPSISEGIAYVGSRDAKFYALNIKSGDTLWSKDEFDRSWMPSSAAISKENIYTGSSDSFRFFSINKETGDINYATNTNAYTFSSPAIDSTMAYIGSANGRLYGIHLMKGDIKWEFKTVGVKNDTIKMFNDEGVMDRERMQLLSKDIKDMPSLSVLYNEALINSGAILSSPSIVNEVIYFGSSDGYIYAITNK